MTEMAVREPGETTLIMIDDNIDEIFLTRREVRKEGIVNRFVTEKKPERIFTMLDELVSTGIDKDTFLILLDVNMPRINGFETLQRIREHPEYKETPVLMLSSSDDLSDIFESMEVGSDGYIVKPFKPDEFFAALQNISRIKKKLLQ